MEYDFASIDYIEKQLRPELYESLYTPLVNLSALLGDINGLLGRRTASSISKDLSLITPGVVVFGQSITDFLKVETVALPMEEFQPQVTYEAYTVFDRIQKNDLSLISSEDVSSPLVNFEKYGIKQVHLKLALGTILLDSFVLYSELLQTTEQVGVENMTLQELHRLIQNVRCVSLKVENLEEPMYEFTRILRDLGRTLAHISSMEWLFTNTYTKRVRDYRNRVSK